MSYIRSVCRIITWVHDHNMRKYLSLKLNSKHLKFYLNQCLYKLQIWTIYIFKHNPGTKSRWTSNLRIFSVCCREARALNCRCILTIKKIETGLRQTKEERKGNKVYLTLIIQIYLVYRAVSLHEMKIWQQVECVNSPSEGVWMTRHVFILPVLL